MFKEKNVLVVVTGSVSAYKAASFVRLLVKDHAHVRVAMTQSAQ
ncbi:flavoprotein, partial [Leuconostoc lactis]